MNYEENDSSEYATKKSKYIMKRVVGTRFVPQVDPETILRWKPKMCVLLQFKKIRRINEKCRNLRV